MQYDMHYYGTYAMAAAAGIPKQDAEVIATAAQFVDDQGVTEWMLCHSNEGILGVATAHHPLEAGVRTLFGEAEGNDTRAVWVPFHFLPGAEGDDFEERMLCRKDGKVARRMLDYYLSDSVIRDHRAHALHLMGIVAHVYADTFSHYGFSGISSDRNLVVAESMEIGGEHSQNILDHLQKQKDAFLSRFASAPKLGHGAALTNPDRPYLKWSFTYATGEKSARDNPETFTQACKALYERFAQFAALYYEGQTRPLADWDKLAPVVSDIIALEAAADERARGWTDAMSQGLLAGVPACAEYDSQKWLDEIEAFRSGDNSQAFIQSHPYKFFVAADYHRNYVLKRLLPSFELLVA